MFKEQILRFGVPEEKKGILLFLFYELHREMCRDKMICPS